MVVQIRGWQTHSGRILHTPSYEIFHPQGPKVGWSSLLLGPFKIPRNTFILCLAILEKLSTLDKPWLTGLPNACILCDMGQTESHEHLFFTYQYSSRCIMAIRREIRFLWPQRRWKKGVAWAARRWRGRHVVNATYRASLASLVYHI
ncbi:UNVERIFIED_CONTAM: hypothetical protein Sradi_6873300 [Sesamum radiatum]|uniref:Reverse transcriptase zinc-binding domain-containing protein n=1 Tax=Sesamum radiatum TaxID=300843 RepID=A0AAW2JKI9_SESRA